MRRAALLPLVLVAACGIGAPPPAHAEKKTVGGNTGAGGGIISKELPTRRADGPGLYDVQASCVYATALTSASTWLITVAGTAQASGPQLAQVTYVKCVVRNTDSGGDLSATVDGAMGGSVAVAAGTVSGWPVRPITICVEAYAIFGPSPVTVKSLQFSCARPSVAGAAASAAVAVGRGTLSPGLTQVATVQSVTFTLDISMGADLNDPSGNKVATGCVFTGQSSASGETVFSGSGDGSVANCLTGQITGMVNYSRTGPLVTLSGTLTINGRTYSIAVASCVFVPTSVQPVVSYALTCLLTA